MQGLLLQDLHTKLAETPLVEDAGVVWESHNLNSSKSCWVSSSSLSQVVSIASPSSKYEEPDEDKDLRVLQVAMYALICSYTKRVVLVYGSPQPFK